jgi:hypothetical protein
LLAVLVDPMTPSFEIRGALDGLRIGFAAHADGEAFALRTLVETCQGPPALDFLVSQVVAAHLAQEGALSALSTLRPGTTSWRDQVRHLEAMMRDHDEHHAACVIPALEDHVPATLYAALPGAYATERLRALAMMQSTLSAETSMTRLRAIDWELS